MAEDGSPRRIGSVAVTVVPQAREFVREMRAQVTPGLRQLGDDIGAELGRAMALRFQADIDRMRAQLDELARQRADIRVRVNDNGDIARLRAQIDSANSSGGNFGSSLARSFGTATMGLGTFLAKATTIGSVVVAGAAAAIPAIAALGAAGAAAAIGGGVLALGSQGIGAAITAAGNLASAPVKPKTASQAASVANAVAQQQQAEAGLASAQRNAATAQRDLTQARIDALNNIVNLRDALAGNALDQQGATLKLAQAKTTLDRMLAAPGAASAQYAAQIAQARLDVKIAQQNVTDLHDKGAQLAQQSADANRKGVAGANNVVAAENRVADAKQAVIAANHSVVVSHQQVQSAATTAATAQTAQATAYQQAMAKLNPLQRDFVHFWVGLKPAISSLSLAASGFLPGLEQGIRNAMPALGGVRKLFSSVSSALGGVFANAGKAISGPGGQKFISFLTSMAGPQIRFFATEIGKIGHILAVVFEQSMPLVHLFEKGLNSILTKLGGVVDGGGFKRLVQTILPIAKEVGAVLGSLGHLAVALIQGLLPAIQPVLGFIKALATELTKIIGPVLKPIITAMSAVFDALKPVLPIIGQALVQIAQAISQVVVAFAPLIGPIVRVLAILLAPVLKFVSAEAGLLAKVLVGLAPVFVIIARGVSLFLHALMPIIPALANGFAQGIKAVAPILPELAKAFVELAQAVTKLLPLLLPIITMLTSALVQGAVVALTVVVKGIALAIEGWVIDLKALGNWIASFATWCVGAYNATMKWAHGISGALAGAFRMITDFFRNLPGAIGGLVSGAGRWLVNAGSSVIQGLLRGITNGASALWSWISSIGSRIGGYAASVYNAGLNLATSLWRGLSTIIQKVGNIGKDLYNAIAGFINRDVLDPMKHWHFTVGYGPISHTFQPFGSIPELPMLATGGVTNGIMAAVIGDNPSGHEAVIPMDSPKTVSMFAAVMTKALGGISPSSSYGPSLAAVGHSSITSPMSQRAGLGATIRKTIIHVHGASDPTATAHAVANRFAARGA